MTKKRIKKTKYELNVALVDQIRFMKKSSEEYDKGDLSEAQRLANAVYTLVHTKGNILALLQQLNVLSSMKFLSTVLDYEIMHAAGRTPLHTYSNIMLNIRPDGRSTFEPCLDNFLIINDEIRWLTFEQWYSENLLNLNEGRISRMDIIRSIRNKDGGAHIDGAPFQDSYFDFKVEGDRFVRDFGNGTVSFTKQVGDTERQAINENTHPIANGTNAMMRQIAYELDKSLVMAGTLLLDQAQL